jgi:serine/threonine protein kinase
VLVLDYVGGGDLASQLAKYRRFCVSRSRFYCAEIAEGLRELHRWGIIYRDCKPENVLLQSSGHIKLTDFGLSKWDSRAKTFCGTAEYLAPEILMEQTYSFAVDWWSLGTFLYEMLTGIVSITLLL